MTLRALVDGTVQQLAVHTVGGVVTPAQELLRSCRGRRWRVKTWSWFPARIQPGRQQVGYRRGGGEHDRRHGVEHGDKGGKAASDRYLHGAGAIESDERNRSQITRLIIEFELHEAARRIHEHFKRA